MLWIYLIICPLNSGPVTKSYLASKFVYPTFEAAAGAAENDKNVKRGCMVMPVKREAKQALAQAAIDSRNDKAEQASDQESK